MSNNLKEELMKALCHDISDEEVEGLIRATKDKLLKGYSVQEIASQLLTALTQVIVISAPELTDEEVLEIADEIGDALIDRMLEYAGHEVQQSEGVPPNELN